MLLRKHPPARIQSQGLWLTLIVIATLCFLQWTPPGWYNFLELFRWYFMAAVAGYLFILQGGKIDFLAARFYIMFNVLSWLSVLLSLLRTPNIDSVLYTAVSSVVPFFLGLVLVSALSTIQGRKIWLYALFTAGFLWAYEIINLWSLYGENIRHYLYGPGNDHNLISVNFSMASIASLTVALYGDFKISKPKAALIKIIGSFICILFYVCTFLSYSRSGFIVTSIGILFTLLTLFFSKNTRVTFVIIVIILITSISFLVSIVQVTNPTWFLKFGEIVRLNDPSTSVYVRTVLLQKARNVILENPIIGIGPGVFKTIYDPIIGNQSFYLVHNSYLTAWAENGILGLSIYIIWLFLWAKFFLTKWHQLNLLSRILTMMFIPFFAMLFFLDIGGFPLHFMLMLFSGLYGEYKS